MTSDAFRGFRRDAAPLADRSVLHGLIVLVWGRLAATGSQLSNDAFYFKIACNIAEPRGSTLGARYVAGVGCTCQGGTCTVALSPRGNQSPILMLLDVGWELSRDRPLPDRILSPGESRDESCCAILQFPEESASITD